MISEARLNACVRRLIGLNVPRVTLINHGTYFAFSNLYKMQLYTLDRDISSYMTDYSTRIKWDPIQVYSGIVFITPGGLFVSIYTYNIYIYVYL